MGSKSKGGRGGMGPTYSYGGNTNMTQQAAQQAYQADLAKWRAPTTTGASAPAYQMVSPGTDPVTGKPLEKVQMAKTVGLLNSAPGMGGDQGPPLPAMGVLPTAPVQNRMALARVMPRQQPYVGMRGGSSPNYGGGRGGAGYR